MDYVVINYVILCMLCTQESAENQLYTEQTPYLNIIITITITIAITIMFELLSTRPRRFMYRKVT